MATFGLLTGSASAGTVFFENFNAGSGDAASQYTLSDEFYVSSSAYFLRTTSGGPYAGTNFGGADGGFVAGLNTNYSAGPYTMTTDAFDISGSSMLEFSFDLARQSNGSFWGEDSYVDFEYSIDGGAWDSLITVDTGGVDNTLPLFDGVAITNTFATFSTIIGGLSGTSMELRVTWTDLSVGDSLGIDSVHVAAVPMPPAALAGLGLLAGLGVYRRLRR